MAQAVRYIFAHQFIGLMIESAGEDAPQRDAILLYDFSKARGVVKQADERIHQLSPCDVLEETTDLFQIMFWDVDGETKLHLQWICRSGVSSPGAEHPRLQVA